MKIIFVMGLLIIMISCSEKNIDESNRDPVGWLDITKNISTKEFESIKNFILVNGDKQGYCNIYGNNPHYTFNSSDSISIESYLNPEVGQKNAGCNPDISDFNEIVLRILRASPQYYYIHIVRQGDIKNDEIFYALPFGNTAPNGAKENKVYLIKADENFAIYTLESKITGYLEVIRNELNSH